MTNENDNGLIGSLFSGYGGLDLGVGMALGGRMRVAYTSDIEPGPCAIEEYHGRACGCPPNLGDITRIDKKGLPAVDVVEGGSPCFPAGALVLTDRGFTPIEEVRVGDRVLTHLNHWKRVLATGSHIGETIMLKGQGTPGIECTPNHPFWAGHRYQGPWDNTRRRYPTLFKEDGWVHAADMLGHMWLNAGANIPELPIPGFDFTGCQTKNIRLSAGFFYFVGRWLGDGWLDVRKRKHRVASYMKRVYVCDSFDKENELRDSLGESGLHFSVQYKRTTVRFCCSSTALCDWLEGNFGKGASNKTIPAWAFGMREDWRRAMLQGYWDSDGNRTHNGMHATSVSRKLLLGIKMLAAGLGNPSSLSMHVPTRERCVIEGRVVNEKTNFMLTAYDSPRKSIMCDTGYWGHARKIESGRTDVRVYDLTVEDDHSFTVDGIFVRNCESNSIAGLRAGMHEGTRSGLWSHQADIIGMGRVPMAVWENVGGALSASASSREDLVELDKRRALLAEHDLCACDTPSIPGLPAGFTPPDPDVEGAVPLASAYAAFTHDDAAALAAVRCGSCGLPVYEVRDGRVYADNRRLDGAHTAPTIRALGRVLGDLANLGYDAVWRGLEAADCGAPHHRLRIFVTAWPRDPSTAPTPRNARLRRLAALPPIRPAGAPWAEWDEERDVWVEPLEDLFGEQGVFMDAWPKTGVMAAGKVYHAPDGPLGADAAHGGGVAALPTPNASDADKYGPSDADALRANPVKRSVHLVDEIMSNVAVLPTPSALYDSGKAGDAAFSRRRAERGRQLGLSDIVNLEFTRDV